MILAALNTPGVSVFNTRSSRNHTELMLKFLKYPLKIKKEGGNELIEIQGLSQFRGFNYKVPGDISSASFFIVLTLLSKKSEIEIKNVNVNSSRVGIINILNKMGANIKLKRSSYLL